MEVLSNKKLNEVNGGGASLWFTLGGIVTFLVGVFTGIMNPNPCKIEVENEN